MPRAVSPIDDQQLIGACENVPAAVAHVRDDDWQTSRPRKWMQTRRSNFFSLLRNWINAGESPGAEIDSP